MKQIELTQGKFAIVDDEDYKYLNQWKWCFITAGYAQRVKHISGSKKNRVLEHILLHRVLMNCSKGQQVDHINGDGLDNRRENLRISTQAQNVRNKGFSKNNTSGYKGVIFIKSGTRSKRWTARLTYNYKPISLGYFDTSIEAAIAYNKAASIYFGEFARLNQI